MAHPLYHKTLPHVNKPITVHHVNGTSYYGTLQRVTPQGLYLAPHQTMGVAASKQTDVAPKTAEWDKEQSLDANEVFFAPFFFPFAALAGFTLGFAVGARAYYPYPYYPYPYRYPYYW